MLWEAEQWDAKNDWPGTKNFGLESTPMDSKTTEPNSCTTIKYHLEIIGKHEIR